MTDPGFPRGRSANPPGGRGALTYHLTNFSRKLHENKKVLLRERKRHTARRVAIAISCYCGGGSLDKKFFPQSEHVSSQIWCQKIFPLLGGGGPLTKIFSPSLNMYQAKSDVKKFSLYWGGGGIPGQKSFYQSEHVSSQIWCQKCFPLLRPGPPQKSETGYPPMKI